MSKSVKKIIGVVAAIAIPFVAPAVGGAILGSVGISSASAAVAGAVGGAVLGGATSALTGGDWRRGALFGGIGGGISGYLQPAAGTAGTAGAGAGGTTAAGVAPAGVAPAGTAPAGGFFSPTGGGAGLTAAASGTAAAAPVAAGAAGTAAAAAPTTFMEALRQVPARIAQKFTDPTALADLTLRAAGQLAGSALVGEGLSADEQALLNAQTEELAWLQQNNRALFEQRLREAQDLLGEARYFDPEYFGLQAARRQQLAGAAAEREQLRGLTGTRRAAEQRRIRLGTARNVGTAYDVGFGTGVSGRLQTRQAGLAQMPTTAPATYGGYEGLLQSYQQARTGREAGLEGMGDLFGSFTGRRQAGLMGPEEEEDKEPVLGG